VLPATFDGRLAGAHNRLADCPNIAPDVIPDRKRAANINRVSDKEALRVVLKCRHAVTPS
jgi:hypothetical protein